MPSNIGNTKIGCLVIDFNRISTLPKSIGDSNYLYLINASYNRLTVLPSNFDENDYEIIDIEFNFFDMSPGTPARTMMDSIVVQGEKRYLRQLVPVRGLAAQATENSITLSWQPGEDGSWNNNFIYWKVQGYAVYILEDGDLTKLADLDKSTLSYTHADLDPDTLNTYRVAVNYYITGDDLNYNTKCYTEIEAATLPLGASSSSSQDVSPVPGSTPTITGISDNNLPLDTQNASGWVLPVLGIGAVAAIGAFAFFRIKGRNLPK